jgi:hypothetical protein
MKKITIKNKAASKRLNINVGPLTVNLLERFSKLNKEEKKTLEEESKYILSNAVNPKNTIGTTTGIAIGYVQSGKTMSFTTLSTLAADNDFKIIIYFAGVKNNLLDQTVERLEKDLQTNDANSERLNVIQNPSVANDDDKTIAKYLQWKGKPVTLIPVLKWHTHLKNLAEVFQSEHVRETLKQDGVLIIDDEADQASLDSKARKRSINQEKKAKGIKIADFGDVATSATYACILKLRDSIPNHTYIQYTATPQGPLLINLMDMLSPKFHKILTPGGGYTGGKIFFGEGTKKSPINPNDLIRVIPDNEVYNYRENPLKAIPDSLIEALQVYLINAAINWSILKIEKPLSMMIHADRETDATNLFEEWVNGILGIRDDGWLKTLQKPDGDPGKKYLVNDFKKSYKEAITHLTNPPSFEKVLDELVDVIHKTNVKAITSKDKKGNKRKKEDLKVKWNNHPFHILIGAEMLNRGFTIEGLVVSYMPRYSKGISQADTIQQRCRFFGYKLKYLKSCRVYLPEDSIMEYVKYVQHEEYFRHFLKNKSLRDYEQTMVIDPSFLKATKSSILSKEMVMSKLKGMVQINALQYIRENIIYIEEFLKRQKFKNYESFNSPFQNHRYVKLSIKDLIEFLLDFKIGNYPDTMRKSATIQYLKYQADYNHIKQAYVFEMGYKAPKPRDRALIIENDSVSLSNIFQGPDDEKMKGKKNHKFYPGDRKIRLDDSLCIQIHKIIPTVEDLSRNDKLMWTKKVGPQKYLYTLGIYYPDKMAFGFTGIKN